VLEDVAEGITILRYWIRHWAVSDIDNIHVVNKPLSHIFGESENYACLFIHYEIFVWLKIK
jgi:hypothetical protein